MRYRRTFPRGFMRFPKGHDWATADYVRAFLEANFLTK